MAVHVPLSERAQEEARILMLSARNLLHPAHGEPSIGASQDMVLGCYYLTMDRPDYLSRRLAELHEQYPKAKMDELHKRAVRRFSSETEAMMAYSMDQIRLHDPISVRISAARLYDDLGTSRLVGPGELIETTVGRILFNDALPERIRFKNLPMKKDNLKQVIAECFKYYGREATAALE